MTIEKEPFEAWLYQQPRDRRFVYSDNYNCLIASFLNETVGGGRFRVGGWTYNQLRDDGSNTEQELIPKWLLDLLFPFTCRLNPTFFAGDIQDHFTKTETTKTQTQIA